MAIISLKPNIEIIRNYFFSIYISEEEHNKYNKIVKLEPYITYKENAIKDFFERANKIECKIDLNSFETLLNEYSLLKHFDNLLYAGIMIQRRALLELDILKLKNNKRLNEEEKRDTELLSLIKYFFTLFDLDNTQIKVIHKHDKKKSILIKDNLIVSNFFEVAKKLLIETYDYPINENFDMLIDAPQKLTLKTINHLIKENSKKIKVGRKKENRFLFQTIFKLRTFLQNETQIKAEEIYIISNQQCRFIYDYCIELGILKEDDICSLPEEYIRTLFINEVNSRISDIKKKHNICIPQKDYINALSNTDKENRFKINLSNEDFIKIYKSAK